ncbi:MAG: DNA polymerase III subunit [Eubacterium sp.]|nr:DNA polymerase III subunit [Eubacterium sp.]
MDFKQIIGHEDIISRFISSIEADHVSHAYIISGEEGSGRNTLAYCFAKTLQCESGSTEACGQCKSCKQAESGNHPDIIYIESEEDKNIIPVKQIREELVGTMDIKPYSSRYKIYIIKGGEKMASDAQSALLKTIEEPPEYGIVIILTTQPEKLLPTIRSRCVSVQTRPVKETDIHNYLVGTLNVPEDKARFAIEYSQGNLGKAIKLATNEEYEALVHLVVDLMSNIFEMDMEDITSTIQHAENYKMNINDFLDLMMMWYRDILVLKVTGNPDKIHFNDQYTTIRDQANYLSFNELEAKSKAITAAKERLDAKAKFEDIMRLLIMTLKEV